MITRHFLERPNVQTVTNNDKISRNKELSEISMNAKLVIPHPSLAYKQISPKEPEDHETEL